MLFSEPQTLIVVYKDELLVNQFKKLVETKDDISDDEIIGTKDDSVRVVAWTEKIWNDQKKAGNINNKVLFIGEIKGVKDLMPVLDIKHDSFGVRYGWAGNQAAILCDSRQLSKAEEYNAFLGEFNKFPVPEILKSDFRKVNAPIDELPEKGFFNKLKNKIFQTSKTVYESVQDVQVAYNEKVKRQQYIFGINKLYEKHLEEFMQK